MLKVYPSWFIFLSLNLRGLTIIFRSTNWLMIWIGFELSIIGFLPIFLINKLAIESIVKYLLIQASGSTLIIISFIANSMILSSPIFIARILLKIGIFPFFQWVPVIIATIRWMGCLILSTIQKLGPIFIILKVNSGYISILLIRSRLGILIRGVIGINQIIMRPLLGYSSISHTRWIVTSTTFNYQITLCYIFIYFWVSFILFSELQKINKDTVIRRRKDRRRVSKIQLIILTAAGIPPFSIFFLKIIILFTLVNNILIVFPIILGAILSTYFYLNLIIPNLIKNWEQKEVNNFSIMTIAIVPGLILPLFVFL